MRVHYAPYQREKKKTYDVPTYTTSVKMLSQVVSSINVYLSIYNNLNLNDMI